MSKKQSRRIEAPKQIFYTPPKTSSVSRKKKNAGLPQQVITSQTEKLQEILSRIQEKDSFANNNSTKTNQTSSTIIATEKKPDSDKTCIRVGFLSRIDYGAPGYRKGLLDLAYQWFEDKKVNFVIIAGGIISFRELKDKYMACKKDAREEFCEQIGEELSTCIPKILGIKTYVMISPAYDGKVTGPSIARYLSHIRKDIVFYPGTSERFNLQGTHGKQIGVVLPRVATWHQKNISANPDRWSQDEKSRSTQNPPLVWAVGCFGTHMYKPGGGEIKVPFFSISAIHKIGEVQGSENTVGAEILHINQDGTLAIESASFKDKLRDERPLVSIPKNLSELETAVFKQIIEKPVSLGIISDNLGKSREEIQQALDNLVRIERNKNPGVVFDATSRRYDLDQKFMQERIKYQYDFNSQLMQEDRALVFSCLHGGSVHTDYQFISETIPRIIAEKDIQVVVGCGDYIEGCKHNLAESGEILDGTDYTDHENIAAEHVGAALFRALKIRIQKELAPGRNIPQNSLESTRLAEKLFPVFLCYPGNHDGWTREVRIQRLTTFKNRLHSYISEAVEELFVYLELPVPNSKKLLSDKIVYLDERNNEVRLPSGLIASVIHPHTGGSKTKTQKLQQGMEKEEGNQSWDHPSPVVFIGNFHTAVFASIWKPEIGQQVGVQAGTLKDWTLFESNLMKTVDCGICLVRIRSMNKRILETRFENIPAGPVFVPSKEQRLKTVKRLHGILI